MSHVCSRQGGALLIRQVFAFAATALGAGVASAAVSYRDATFDWSKTPDNTTPMAAADWMTGGNWVNGEAPNGDDWNAILTGATGARYVRLDEDIRLHSLKGTVSGSNVLTLLGDGSVSLQLPDRTYSQNFNSYVPFCWTGELAPNGALSFFANVTGERMTIAGGTTTHSLARYATDTSEKVDCRFAVDWIYQGSGNFGLVSPRCCNVAQAATYRTTKDSPFVTVVDRPSSFLPVVGAAITSDAFPAGTFAKRCFDGLGDTYEMSAPALESGDHAITFAAHTPSTYVRIPLYQRASYLEHNFIIDRNPHAGEYRVEIDRFAAERGVAQVGSVNVSTNQTLTLKTTSSYYQPGTLVIHNAGDAHIDFFLGCCHLELAENPVGPSGFPLGSFADAGADSLATVTVTNGLVAVMPNFRFWRGKLVKDGAGAVSLGFTNDVSRYTGEIEVREGTVELPAGAWVRKMTVAAGATLKIDGEFAPEELVVEKGANVVGDGLLVIPEGSFGLVNDISFGPGTQVRVAGGCGEIFAAAPEPEVVGNPAFWVDARAASSIVTKDNDGTTVIRWNDCRKTSDDDGYLYAATDVLDTLPGQLVKDADGAVSHVALNPRVSTVDITQTRELAWSQPITNIYAVFIVQNPNGGQLLGTSKRLRDLTSRRSDFTRAPSSDVWSGPLLHTGNGGTAYPHQQAAMDADFYHNGNPAVSSAGYPYAGGVQNVGPGRGMYLPVVTELVNPRLPLASDCFAFDWGEGTAAGRNANKRICELLVYTNRVTYSERLKVAGYLMKKWMNADINYKAAENGSLGAVDVANRPHFVAEAGENLVIDELSGEGAVTKSGAGELYIAAASDAAADLVIAGGTVTLRSESASDVSDLPSGAVIHLDATTIAETVKDGDSVTSWASRNGGLACSGQKPTGGRYPVLKRGIPRDGLAMVDFGPVSLSSAMNANSGAMTFTRQNDLKSLFMVQNTSGGGLPLFGENGSYSYGGLLRGGWYTRYSNKVSGYDPTSPFTASDSLVGQDYNGGLGYDKASRMSCARVWLNGELVDQSTTGFTGGDDLLSFVSYIDISANTIGVLTGHMTMYGGGKLGEYIVYDRALNDRDAKKVEAYLRKKWFNADTAGYTPAVVGAVSVAKGAALQVVGGAPISATSLAGAGTVTGADVSGVTALVAGQDGCLTVDGTVSFGAAVSVTASFDTMTAKDCAGLWPLVKATAFENLDLSTWTFAQPVTDRVVCGFKVVDDTVCLSIEKKGAILIVR